MLSYICIIISLFIPLFCAGYAKFSQKGYDNHTPREFLAKGEGRSLRAHHAQNNFYETFPAFGISVLAAHQLNAPVAAIDALAGNYVFCRLLYAYCYINDFAVARTIFWFIAFGTIIALYLIGF